MTLSIYLFHYLSPGATLNHQLTLFDRKTADKNPTKVSKQTPENSADTCITRRFWMLIPFQSYPVAPLARNARGTRDSSLALSHRGKPLLLTEVKGQWGIYQSSENEVYLQPGGTRETWLSLQHPRKDYSKKKKKKRTGEKGNERNQQ